MESAEQNDPDVSKWKIARSLIEHENGLIGQRLTWLLTSQTVLLSIYSFILGEFNKYNKNAGCMKLGFEPVTLLVLAVVGVYICLSAAVLLNAAVRQLRAVDDWWEKLKVEPHKLPVLHDFKERRRLSVLNTENIPFVFIFVWIVLGLSAISTVFPDDWNNLVGSWNNWVGPRLSTVIPIVIGAVLAWIIRWLVQVWKEEL